MTRAHIDKTITVKVARDLPVWLKWSQETDVKETTCTARDEENKCHVGDLVRIEEVPPSSGHWRLKAVLERRKQRKRRNARGPALGNAELARLMPRLLSGTDPAADATAQRPGKPLPVQRQPRRAPPEPAMPTRASTESEPMTSGNRKRGTGDKRAKTHGGNRVRIGQKPEAPTSKPKHTEKDERVVPFAKRFRQSQTTTPSDASARPVVFPPGGLKTEESALRDTDESAQTGRVGAYVTKTVRRWQLTEAAAEFEGKFRSMVLGDYDGRCQICGTTFGMSNGELQVFVIHIVPPSKDPRTNNFGNLVGLCGWHAALVRYGKWVLCDPVTREPCRDWEHMRESALNASEEMDDEGNPYVRLRVRFWNVYQGWESTPGTVDEEVRYSIPHWTYLRELLST